MRPVHRFPGTSNVMFLALRFRSIDDYKFILRGLVAVAVHGICVKRGVFSGKHSFDGGKETVRSKGFLKKVKAVFSLLIWAKLDWVSACEQDWR